ncbi:MAG: hypothetical protein R3F61_29665 [Myxococcota bacterium]
MRWMCLACVVVPALLACAGPATPVAVSAASAPDGLGEVRYRRYKNLDDSEVLDFVSAEKATVYYPGRFSDKKPRVGTWTRDGFEVTLDLEATGGSSAEVWHLHQTGRCSLALYRRDPSSGAAWASGDLRPDGENLVQPILFEQKWPSCDP